MCIAQQKLSHRLSSLQPTSVSNPISNLLIVSPYVRVYASFMNNFICKPAVIHIGSNKMCSASVSQANSICCGENEIGDCNFAPKCHHFVYINAKALTVYPFEEILVDQQQTHNIHDSKWQWQWQYCIK